MHVLWVNSALGVYFVVCRSHCAVGKRQRFDVRKQKPSSQKARETRLTKNDMKTSLATRPTMVETGTQNENQWFSSDVEVQTKS